MGNAYAPQITPITDKLNKSGGNSLAAIDEFFAAWENYPVKDQAADLYPFGEGSVYSDHYKQDREAKKTEGTHAKGIYIDTSHIDTNTSAPSPRGESVAGLFVSLRVVSI